MVLPFQNPTAAAMVVLDGIKDAGQAGLHVEACPFTSP
jgi:hypothetical protein